MAFRLCARVLRCLVLLWVVAGSAARAAGLPPGLSEFKHEAWPLSRGAPSRINAITQTPDGFLWIGSVEGLFRFDGVSFEPVRMPGSQAQRLVVSSLHVARSGELWVGLARGRGVVVLRGGQLVDAGMPNPSREVNDIREDAEGGLWVARGGRSEQGLARWYRGQWQEFGIDSGLPAQPVWGLHMARDGTVWAVLSRTLALRRPGDSRFSTTGPAISALASLTEDDQGQLWVSDSQGTRALTAAAGPLTSFPHPNPVGGTRLLFDARGDLWTTTRNGGVLRIRAPGRSLPAGLTGAARMAALDTTAGLTSDQTRALFQDREGNLWVGTELGLDQLRPAAVVVEPGLPANSPTSYRLAAARDGTVYVADAQALYAIPPGQPPQRLMRLGSPAEALCAAVDRGVWLFLADRVLKVDGPAPRAQAKPAGTTAYGCAHDADGRLWMPALAHGLHVMAQGRWDRWPERSPTLPANAVVDDRGRAVVLFRAAPPVGPLPFVALDARQSAAGAIEGLLPTDLGVLVSGHLGLTVAGAAAASPLAATRHPWAASLNGIAQTPDGETWAIGDAGVVRLRTADLARALQQPQAPLTARVFDFQDGLDSFVQKAPGAQMAVGGDGRIWFLTRRHVMRVEPGGLVPNRLPPPVQVRELQVGEDIFPAAAEVKLPPGTTTVRVAFTALSLTVPERVRFSHRLVGVSDAWSEPGVQRSALLSDLGPGTYRFELRASNNDGLWAEQPAQVTLVIPATFTQSLPFRVGAAVLLLALLYGFYLMRLRQYLARARERSQERLRERERIAREMHDTLLQSVQGLILRFQSVVDRVAHDPGTREALQQAVDRAESVLVDGRDRLQGLRRVDTGDMEDALRRVLAEQPFAPDTRRDVISQGTRRGLRPTVFDEVLCIVSEALFNAARHAHATQVEVRLIYGRRWLEIVVQDDGVGMPAARADEAARRGHFGMVGMAERAQRIGAQLRIDGHSAAGTRVLLRLRSRIAYAPDAG
jgi:signal transduction histidine kinase/ligand-binding sensor domain-containing protein